MRLGLRATLTLVALAGLAAAVFCIGGGDGFSLPDLAGYLQLDDLRDVVGDWLGALESDGPTAWWTVLAGACAAILGDCLLQHGELETAVTVEGDLPHRITPEPQHGRRARDGHMDQLRRINDRLTRQGAHAATAHVGRDGAQCGR